MIKCITIFFQGIILFVLLSCTIDSTQKISSKKNVDKKSNVNVSISGDISSGVCYGCD